MQVQIQKALNQINFLTTTVYEKYDLTNQIGKEDKFVVRQGDLIVTNYYIFDLRKRGLRRAWREGKNGIFRYLGSHIVIPQENETILIHPEHGITIIPMPIESLSFYTFSDGGD